MTPTHALHTPAPPLAVATAIVLLHPTACGEVDVTKTTSHLRAVVKPEHPLSLSNPSEHTVSWPLWGGSFGLNRLVLHASLNADGTGGLVIAGPGPVAERVAIELIWLDGRWALDQTIGGEPVHEQATPVAPDQKLVLELTPTEVRVADATMVLTEPLGPVGAEAGVYVTLGPGASLHIDDLAVTAPLPTHPELGTPLRELAARRGLDIGTALDVWPPLHDLALESLLGEQFSRLAPTEFYWPTTRGEDQDFFFLPADLAVNYALVHEQGITGMFLIWDYALPDWVLELHESGDVDALAAVFDEHITTTVERYAGRVDAWIVVNEAIWGFADSDEPADFAQTLWLDALGPDYVEHAFELARAADGNAVLIYNETGAEVLNDKSDFMFAMASDFVARGVPIDGVGLQFHVHAGQPPNMADVQANMERFAALGLSVHVTEFDVSLEGIALPQDQAQALQAEIYADVLEACLAVPACENWTVFGFCDRYAWDELGDAEPLLFDAAYQPKPAFFAVQDALRGVNDNS